jgi:hypothetical protein
MILATTCARCRTIRRFLLAFALGVAVAWQINGAPPLGLEDDTWRGVTFVILIFAVMTVFARMHQIRKQFQR